MKLIYDINDRPKFGEVLVFAFQQMIAIMAATLLVPILVTSYGLESDPAAALFGAGIGTIVYLLCTKRRSPVFLGSAFAFLGAYSASVAQNYGYWGVIIGVALASAVYVIGAIVIRFVGSAWVNYLLPAVIIGPVVALIGLSLSSTATSWMMYNGGGSDDYSLISIVCGLFTFLIIVLASVKGTKTMKLIPFIIGIGAGYVLALVLTVIGNAANIPALQIMSFQPFVDNFAPFTLGSIFRLPDFTIVRAIQTQGQFVPVDGAMIGNLAIIYVPISIVALAEHIADHKNLSNIIGRDLITDPGLSRTLLGDGLGSVIGSIAGGCANTTYGESVGCIAITGNASVVTIFTTAIGCMVLSFFTPFVVLINTIPKCVMGGACVALYGFIAVSGLQMLKKVDLGNNKNLFVVSAILVTGIGGMMLNFGTNELTGGPLLSVTSLAVALIVGILTNLVVNGGKMTSDEPVDNLTGAVESMGTVEVDDTNAKK